MSHRDVRYKFLHCKILQAKHFACIAAFAEFRALNKLALLVKVPLKYLKIFKGNESPVDVYVNNTGLMWELGKKLGARLVFAEHRCEPSSSLPWCGPTSQACAFAASGN